MESSSEPSLTLKIHPSKPDEPGTWSRKSIRKSPSTVRRDQRRLKSFLERKSAQESPGSPTATSTPITKPGLASASQENLMSGEKSVAILEEKETDSEKLKNEGLDQRPGKEKERDHETKLKETQKMSPAELADFNEIFKKGLAPLNKAMDNNLQILDKVQACFENKDRNVDEHISEQSDDDEEDEDDNINNAKIWAQQQKQSCIK